MMNSNNKLNQMYRYNNARHNLLLALIFTAVNCVLVSTNTYFLFSAYVPLFLVSSTYYMFSASSSSDFLEIFGFVPTQQEFEAFQTVAVVFLILAIVILILYFLCWIFSKKHVGWMIAALVLFSLDTIIMLYFGIDASMIIDIIFHAYVLVYLVIGIVAYFKEKSISETLPAETVIAAQDIQENNMQDADPVSHNSAPLYYADNGVKCKVFLTHDAGGCHIEYRRVKRTNELIINGAVYDTYEALVEMPHSLVAVYNGMHIEAGTDKSSKTYIAVDGEIVVQKLRLI